MTQNEFSEFLFLFFSNEDYGGSEHENEGKVESQGEPEQESGDVPTSVDHHQARISRPHLDEKDTEQALLFATVIRDIFGDFDDDEQEEHAVQNQINQDDNACRSPEDKRGRVKELRRGVILPDENVETKLKGKAVVPPVLFEIPLRPHLVHPDQMATFKISNIIGIDPKPFDPSTYVEEDFYVTDMSGSRRHIPPSNIIRWRKVTNPDATTSVESNARFATWSDGSLQLLIGNEAFDVSEQDVKDMQSHLFLRHRKGIFSAHGQISRKLKFMPSSLSSNIHHMLTAQVNSQNKTVNKVKHCITDVDPEWVMEQKLKDERQKAKANNKKKVTHKYISKGRKESRLSTGFLKDTIDEERKATQPSASSSSKSTQRPFYFSKSEKVELEFEHKGKKAECSQSHRGIEEIHKGEAEEAFEDSEIGSENPKARSKESGGTLKKQYIESDEDSPPRRTTTRRRMAIVYDSNEE
ncbi:hypothetical protein Pfo_027250 [Paulownia fortunei]|nr:hypothetical protein Pfo_027250 [Paulownia fortunei]